MDGVEGVEKLWEEDSVENRREYEAMKQALFDAMSMNMKRIVRQTLAPLSSLRNPET